MLSGGMGFTVAVGTFLKEVSRVHKSGLLVDVLAREGGAGLTELFVPSSFGLCFAASCCKDDPSAFARYPGFEISFRLMSSLPLVFDTLPFVRKLSLPTANFEKSSKRDGVALLWISFLFPFDALWAADCLLVTSLISSSEDEDELSAATSGSRKGSFGIVSPLIVCLLPNPNRDFFVDCMRPISDGFSPVSVDLSLGFWPFGLLSRTAGGTVVGDVSGFLAGWVSDDLARKPADAS